ncbi:MAG: GIY-YIG nuclease family protein [Thermoleophilia bacterium]
MNWQVAATFAFLNPDPQVTGIPDLHKIGYTTTTTRQRIGNAEHEKTYLNAPVEIIAEYAVPAAIASGVETTLHHFFAAARLDVTYERDGQTVKTADEWFSVPLPVIDESISLLNAETIISFEYDTESRTIGLRTNP